MKLCETEQSIYKKYNGQAIFRKNTLRAEKFGNVIDFDLRMEC